MSEQRERENLVTWQRASAAYGFGYRDGSGEANLDPEYLEPELVSHYEYLFYMAGYGDGKHGRDFRPHA